MTVDVEPNLEKITRYRHMAIATCGPTAANGSAEAAWADWRAHRASWPHLYGPAARCKPKSDDLEKLVLRFCIRPIDGALELLAIMDIRARSISFASRPRRPYGPPDHERAGETFLHLLFPTRRPRWESQLNNCFGGEP